MAMMNDPNEEPKEGQDEIPNLDDLVVSRDEVRPKKPLQLVVGHDWIAYSNTDTTAGGRVLFGGVWTHVRYVPDDIAGLLHILKAKPTDKGAEALIEGKSRKTVTFNIWAGLAKFNKQHIAGTNMVFTVTLQESTKYGKAMVVDVNSLRPKAIRRIPRKKKPPQETGQDKKPTQDAGQDKKSAPTDQPPE